MQEKRLVARIKTGWSYPFGMYQAEAKDIAHVSALSVWEKLTSFAAFALLLYAMNGLELTRQFVANPRAAKFINIGVVLIAAALFVVNYVLAGRLKPYIVKEYPRLPGIMVIAAFLLLAIVAVLLKLPYWAGGVLLALLLVWVVAGQIHFLRSNPKPPKANPSILDPSP